MSNHAEIQDLIRYHFRRPDLLYEATLAAGASMRKGIDGDVQGNKPLALIGDALIRLDVAVRSYDHGVKTAESGHILAAAGSNQNLEALGRQLGIAGSITKNTAKNVEVPRTTLASTVEALIGAVWVDSENNFSQVQEAIEALGITEPFWDSLS
ncbi:RNase III domain-containing protein [Madurella fahalii]|uniref:RNase III domain-containing protein n=1 Tax=Madurella fahalii TaxID=1157608 RepID=A0ABQ0G3G0_9PEZI